MEACSTLTLLLESKRIGERLERIAGRGVDQLDHRDRALAVHLQKLSDTFGQFRTVRSVATEQVRFAFLHKQQSARRERVQMRVDRLGSALYLASQSRGG